MGKYHGQCACGAVSATIDGEAVTVRNCWCRQCQQLAGGMATTNAMFPLSAITLTGELAAHGYVAASGNTLTHEYCARCGTPVMGHSSARPEYRAIRIGFLDPGHDLRPRVAIWTDEAPDWAVIDPALEHWPRQPPPPVPVNAS